jgi:TrwC relaxase
MLSIGKLGIGQERYYLDKVAEGAEDYYSGEGEAEGQWLGDAAKELGLDGAVKAEQLTAMLTGRNPATGEPLGLRAVGGRGAVPGFDLTFSVPKSASLLWALGDAETSARRHRRHRKVRRRRARLPPARGLLDPARSGRGVRQGQRLPRRRLPPPLLPRRRSPGSYPHADRQRDPRAGRQVDPALPPGDLRPRQDGGLSL